jgi:NifB/MoaA-like Fe-S oxidoreductase
MNQLRSLIDNNIRLHCQIVLIPGVIDGTDIIKTITDLGRLYPGVASIGVVPVGKTKYLRGISLVSRKLARNTIGLVETLHKKFRQKYKKGIVYCADEFYIKAGFPIPETSYYDDFPQHENGIGIVRLFIDEIKGLNRIKKMKGEFLILVGISALPFLNMLKMKLTQLGCIDNNNIKIKGVENSFFGNSVTVSGLIGAHDFTRTISGQDKTYDHIILPPNCVNDSAEFIDDKTIDDKRVLISPDSVKELLQCLQ